MPHFIEGFARNVDLYGELSHWYPLLTSPEAYAEEAEAVAELLEGAQSLLELGSGAGHLASQLDLEVVLSDRSPEMLELSREVNPSREHVLSDLRELRLGRTFDAVLLHDASGHLEREGALAAIQTALAHLGPGGRFLVMPDFVAENLAEKVDDGGRDSDEGAVRYLAWHTPLDQEHYRASYAVMCRDASGRVEVYKWETVEAALPTDFWMSSLSRAGFHVDVFEDDWGRRVFLGSLASQDLDG